MEQQGTIKALAGQLSDVRRRGLANIDLNTPAQPCLALPDLEALARRHADDLTGRRIELIRRLLLDGLQAYSEQGFQPEARFIRSLFFDEPGGTIGRRQPGELLKTARQASRLGQATFDKRRAAIFRDFASYLIAGKPVQQVQVGQTPAVEPTAPADIDQSQAEPAADQPSAAVAEPGAVVAVKAGEPAFSAALKTLTHRRSVRRTLLAGAAVVAIVMVGGWWIGRPHVKPPSATGTHTSSGAPSSGASRSTTTVATLTFDDLGGGSPTIHVFPGIKDTPNDKIPNGTYRKGDKVSALCQAKGRPITSDTTAGERPERSDLWVRIAGEPAGTQYASMTYADVPPEVLSNLAWCEGMP